LINFVDFRVLREVNVSELVVDDRLQQIGAHILDFVVAERNALQLYRVFEQIVGQGSQIVVDEQQRLKIPEAHQIFPKNHLQFTTLNDDHGQVGEESTKTSRNVVRGDGKIKPFHVSVVLSALMHTEKGFDLCCSFGDFRRLHTTRVAAGIVVLVLAN
jgi:hypothetical protein